MNVNAAWRGSGYRAARRRLVAARGPAAAHACADCGGTARFWCYDGDDPAELADPTAGRYSLDPGRYEARCSSCQRLRAAGHRPVTPETVGRVVELYQGGASLASVATALGIPRPAVRTALAARDVPIRPRSHTAAGVDAGRVVELYAAGQSLARIAGALDVTAATVRRVLLAQGMSIRPSCRAGAGPVDVERAAALYAGGASVRGIAELLGVGRAALRAALTGHGVTIRPAGPVRKNRDHRTPADEPNGAATPPEPSDPQPRRVIFQPLPATSPQPTRHITQ